MLLNPKPEEFDPKTIEFELWCGDRLQIAPDPSLWKAIQKAKRGFSKGRTVLIKRTHIEGKQVLVEIGLLDK